MRKQKIYQSVKKIVAGYEKTISATAEIDFQTTPPTGGWSYSEVFSHIFDSSLLSVTALQNCIIGSGEVKKTHLIVKLILFFGMFPPGRKYKVPKRLESRVKKINKMAAQQLMVDFKLQLVKICPLIEKADPKIKTKHPRLGYLNAEQWFRFIEIHLKHHLKQLRRIENSMAATK